MKANETTFNKIINQDGQQYVVPLFQRPYSWEKDNWETLLEDLDFLYQSDDTKLLHFIGSMVTIPVSMVPEGMSKFLLIDGQQRITTIFILLTVLSDLAEQQNNSALATRIKETYLINRWEKGDDRFKLLPTQTDRDVFQNLVMKRAESIGHRLNTCYEYIRRKITKYDLEKFLNVVVFRLSIVSIVLDSDDNPHLVFESLNAKGRQLTEADLIRNYFFMRIDSSEHDAIYQTYWQPMQEALEEHLTEFIRHYLMRDGTWIKQSHIYVTLKATLDNKPQSDVLSELQKIYRYAIYYYRLLYPQFENSQAIQYYVHRLNRIKTIAIYYPFLLDCYHDYDTKSLSESEFEEILGVIENYSIRRQVCNIPTNQFNKVFPSLYKQAKEGSKENSSFVNRVKLELQKRKYPTDEAFYQQLVTADLYGGGDRSERLRLILETLENRGGGKETLKMDKTYSIEHIMPQTLSTWWEQHLGEDADQTHEIWLHTLGNLTLTAYNSELSNASFPDKQQLLRESRSHLNRYFSSITSWKQQDIEARGKQLAREALQIWSYFGTPLPKGNSVKGEKPINVTILGEKHAVSSWREVMQKTLDTLLLLDPQVFDLLVKRFPSHLSYNPERIPRHNQLANGCYFQIGLNAVNIKKFCEKVIREVGWSDEDWSVETA